MRTLQALIITVLQLSHQMSYSPCWTAPSPHHSTPSPSSPEPRQGTLCKRIFCFRMLHDLIITVLQLSHQLSHSSCWTAPSPHHSPPSPSSPQTTVDKGHYVKGYFVSGCFKPSSSLSSSCYISCHILLFGQLLHLIVHLPHPLLQILP